jgi:hypothetical protein
MKSMIVIALALTSIATFATTETKAVKAEKSCEKLTGKELTACLAAKEKTAAKKEVKATAEVKATKNVNATTTAAATTTATTEVKSAKK